ncbi:transmembrane protein 116 [Lissotriton helveticus]
MDYRDISVPVSPTFDHDDDAQWKSVFTALQWVQFLMSSLSIIGSSSIIAYAVLQRSVRSPEVRPLFYLSVSDLLLGFCWLIGASLYGKTLRNHDIACYNLQTTGQIFYMSTFFYTAHYTWQLHIDLKDKINSVVSARSSLLRRMAIILSSFLPLILMIPVFSFGNHNECYQNYSQVHSHRCLLMHNAAPVNSTAYLGFKTAACTEVYFYGLAAFLVTFIIACIIILVPLFKVCTVQRRYVQIAGPLDNHQSILIRVAERRVVLYPAAFICCWGPAFFLGLVKLFDYNEHGMLYIILYVLQAFTAPSQGLLNCLVYGWTQNFYRFLKRSMCQDASTQTPLLRVQKKKYESLQAAGHKVDGSTNTLA